MAKTLVEEHKAQIAAGAKELGSFSGNVRNMDANDPLAEGDVIAIPKTINALSAEMVQNGQTVMRDGKPVVLEFILVEVTNKDGNKRVTRFFPNQLAKIAFPINEEGKVTGKVKTTGTATMEYCKYSGVQEAMQALAGKNIKVSKSTEYTVWNFGRTAKQQTHIYQYDFA